MKKKFIVLFGIVLLILLAVITNPRQEEHKEAVKAKFNTYLQKSMSKNLSEADDEWKNAGQALGMLIGGSLVDVLTSNIVTTDNYVLFSTTKMTWEGETKVVGVGILGNVFLSSKIDKALDEGLLAD